MKSLQRPAGPGLARLNACTGLNDVTATPPRRQHGVLTTAKKKSFHMVTFSTALWNVRSALPTAVAAALLLLLLQPAWAQVPGGIDPPGRVARMNLADGPVSYAPADARGHALWTAAALNRPLTTGDRLWTGQRARSELHIGSTAVRMAEQTSLDFLALDDDTTQLRLAQGTLRLRVRNMLRLKALSDFFQSNRSTLEHQVRERTAEVQRLGTANESLEHLSLHDALTDLANRRLFERYLAEQIAIARRHHRSLALILYDVDSFKAFNDHYGHPAGDECLKQIAGALRSCCRRPADMAARHGGEEFAMILPDTELDSAVGIAEAARSAVMELKIPHERSTAAAFASISGGGAVLMRTGDMTAQQLTAAADSALYQAKHRGRNQIVFAQA